MSMTLYGMHIVLDKNLSPIWQPAQNPKQNLEGCLAQRVVAQAQGPTNLSIGFPLIAWAHDL